MAGVQPPDRGGKGRRRRWRGPPESSSILVGFLFDSGLIVVNDLGGLASNPLRRDCQGRILNALSGFSRVSTA